MWFKEYTMNAVMQPIHLILYTVFVGSAYELVAKNPLYALVALGFLVPAEKFIKKMFGLDKGESTSGFASFAGGATTMAMVKGMTNMIGGGKDKNGNAKGNRNEDESGSDIFVPSTDSGDFNPFLGSGSGANNRENEDEQAEQPQETEGQQLAREIRERREAGETMNPEYWRQRQEEIRRQREEQAASRQAAEQIDTTNPEYWRQRQEEMQARRQGEEMLGTGTYGGSGYRPNASRRFSYSGRMPQARRSIVGSIGRVATKGIKNKGRQLWYNKGKYTAKALKGTAKFVGRKGLRLAGAAAGAAVLAVPSIAAAVTTGDFSKGAQLVTSGMATGGSMGRALGNRTYNGVETMAGGIENAVKGGFESFREERYGIEGAREIRAEKQNERARRQFMINKQEQKRYQELAEQLGYNDVDNLMQAAADYKEAGVTDNKMIEGALKAEHRLSGGIIGGNNHEQFVDVAAFAQSNSYGRADIEDDKKRTSFENVIENHRKLQGNPNAQREIAQTFAEIWDRGDMYKNVGRFWQSQTSNNNNPQGRGTSPRGGGSGSRRGGTRPQDGGNHS